MQILDLMLTPDAQKSRRIEHQQCLFSNQVAHVAPELMSSEGCSFSRCGVFRKGQLGVYTRTALQAFRPLHPSFIKVTSHAHFLEVAKKVLDDLWVEKQARLASPSQSFRWTHGEADGFPGLVADVYGSLIVVQSSSQSGDFLLPFFVDAIKASRPSLALFERSSGQTRQMMKLPERTRVLVEPVPEEHTCEFVGSQFVFRPRNAQKTGLFLDQASNLVKVSRLIEHSQNTPTPLRSVLDICSYMGAWSVFAARSGCDQFTLIDQDKNALFYAEQNIQKVIAAQSKSDTRQQLEIKLEHGDLFEKLSALKKDGAQFDVVVADPPAFAKSKANIPEATRAYQRLFRLASQRVRANGLLVLCSCSRNLTEESFTDLISTALADSGPWVVLESGHQSPDHTVLVGDTQSHYLKCVFLKRLAGSADSQGSL
jgi:23S rRNA (cytosine1962-C5)-methyltransferase